jgi:hypothetical protein
MDRKQRSNPIAVLIFLSGGLIRRFSDRSKQNMIRKNVKHLVQPFRNRLPGCVIINMIQGNRFVPEPGLRRETVSLRRKKEAFYAAE